MLVKIIQILGMILFRMTSAMRHYFIYLNTESMVYVKSEALNAQLTEQNEDKKDTSRQVFIDGKM